MSEQTAQTPNDPIDNFADFLGAYTIILNGTTIEKQANQPMELSVEHRKELVDKFKCLNAKLIAENKRMREALKSAISALNQIPNTKNVEYKTTYKLIPHLEQALNESE